MDTPRDDIYNILEEEILQLLDEKLSPELLYHNKAHTTAVINAVKWLGEAENVSETDRYLLKMAALFHDTGFIKTYEGHEAESCRIARHYLSELSIESSEVKVICKMIMATKIPHNPQNHLERIICDADLNYLGTSDFFEIGERLRQELFLYGKITGDQKTWKKTQLQFLESHSFFTETAKRERSPVKEKHVAMVKDLDSGSILGQKFLK